LDDALYQSRLHFRDTSNKEKLPVSLSKVEIP
jgi:hypothetical protein